MDNVEIALAEFTQLGKVARRANDEHALVPWRCTYAMSGAMVATGDAEQAPLNAGVPITQLSAGMRTYIAILMALLRRQRHGNGARPAGPDHTCRT